MKKKKKKKKKKNFKKWIKNKTYLYVFCDSSQCYGGFKLGHRACSYARDPHLICISISKVGTTPEDSCLAAIRSQPGRPTGTSFCTEWCGGYNLLLTNLQLPLRALVSDTLRQRVATGASLKSARWRRKSCLELCGVVSYTGWNQCDLLLLSSSSSSSFFFLLFFFFSFLFFFFFSHPLFSRVLVCPDVITMPIVPGESGTFVAIGLVWRGLRLSSLASSLLWGLSIYRLYHRISKGRINHYQFGFLLFFCCCWWWWWWWWWWCCCCWKLNLPYSTRGKRNAIQYNTTLLSLKMQIRKKINILETYTKYI